MKNHSPKIILAALATAFFAGPSAAHAKMVTAGKATRQLKFIVPADTSKSVAEPLTQKYRGILATLLSDADLPVDAGLTPVSTPGRGNSPTSSSLVSFTAGMIAAPPAPTPPLGLSWLETPSEPFDPRFFVTRVFRPPRA